MKALIVYGISRLAPSIYDLREIGYDVETVLLRDEQQHQYAQYELRA